MDLFLIYFRVFFQDFLDALHDLLTIDLAYFAETSSEVFGTVAGWPRKVGVKQVVTHFEQDVPHASEGKGKGAMKKKSRNIQSMKNGTRKS